MAVKAKEMGIIIHATCVTSTHHHMVISDPNRELPNFLREMHRLIALSVKIYRKWEGPLWDNENPSVVELRTPQAVAEKIAYVLSNPVDIGAVYDAKHWPGVVTKLSELGTGVLKAKRPDVYFDENNEQWPQEVSLKLEMPPVLEEYFDDPIDVIEQEYERLCQSARQKMKAEGRSFMGVDKILKLSPYKRAKSWEDLRSLNPTFAVGRGQHEARNEAIAILKHFRNAYRDAMDKWKARIRDVEFPMGTWWMVVFHNAMASDTAYLV